MSQSLCKQCGHTMPEDPCHIVRISSDGERQYATVYDQQEARIMREFKGDPFHVNNMLHGYAHKNSVNLHFHYL